MRNFSIPKPSNNNVPASGLATGGATGGSRAHSNGGLATSGRVPNRQATSSSPATPTTRGATGLATSGQPVRLCEEFAKSKKFAELFVYGMALVEETADFLDREGRYHAVRLPQAVKMLYSSESMRLTTRLMQVASWLLLQRSLLDGDMQIEQAMLEKKNIRLNNFTTKTKSPFWHKLPEQFIDIIERSLVLQQRIFQLDKDLYNKQMNNSTNHVAEQHDLLQSAFK